MSFTDLNEVERILGEKGHEYIKSYTAFENGELRIISEREGRQYRWIPVYDEYGQIIALKEKP